MSVLGTAFAGDEPTEEELEQVRANLSAVHERVRRAGGDPGRLGVVAVTKGFGLAAVRCALAVGLVDIGENYADELVAKAGRLAELAPSAAPRWHFLGAVQRNKLGRLAGLVARFESLDRLAEGERIARLAPGSSVLVEVDFTGLPGRGGADPDQVPTLVEALRVLPLAVDGLMTIAPRGGAGPAFAALASLAGGLGLAEISMGMSEDLEDAVAAGATSLRLGRALFGPRPPRPGDDPAHQAREVPE